MSIHTYVDVLHARLVACRATNAELAEAGNKAFSESWVSKFRARRMTNPRIDTLMALNDALDALDGRGKHAEARAA